MSRNALRLLALVSSLPWACVDKRSSSGRNESAVLCGLPSAEAPAARPVDPCRDGSLVFGPIRLTRGRGRPAVETLLFHTVGEQHGCVSVVSGGSDRHRVSSGWIDIDGERVVGA